MDAAAAEIRDAASVILLRGDRDSLQILMGMRNAKHKFMPNRLVFPGGRVDAADLAAPAASPLRDDVLALVCRGASPELAHGLGHAVARELEEETGLSFGTPPALDRIDYLCRAVTPPVSPIRFNARFFVAPAAAVSGSLAGSGELENLAWYGLEAVLELDLAPATRAVLEQLTIWLAMDAAARGTRKLPVFMNAQWTEE